MRALVTGGAGFIGSNLVDRLLAEGHEVDVVDDLSTGSLSNLASARASGGELRFHHLDIRLPETVELIARRRPEVIFHLAAQSAVGPSLVRPAFDADVNVVGSLQVLEGARSGGTARVVYAASGGTLYGEPARKDLPAKESLPWTPKSPYGVSKRCVIDYLVAYRDMYDLEFSALALANVYGPRQDPLGEGGVIAIFGKNLAEGRQSTINGDGEYTRDFVFVDDVVDAFSRAAERGGGLVLNIASGKETSINALYDVMAAHVPAPAPPRHGPQRAGDVRRSCLDPGRAGIHLGWKPWTSLAEGTRAVIESFEQAG